MQAIFVSWAGEDVLEVARLRTHAGRDLAAVAEMILEAGRLKGDHRKPDRCTIYVAENGKLYAAGKEVPKWRSMSNAN